MTGEAPPPTGLQGFEIDGNGRSLWSTLRQIPQYRDLVILFTRRDLVAEYKQTLLGPLWIIILPLLTTIVFAVVFGRIAKLSTADVPDFLFYLLGVTFWGLFSTTFASVANLFVVNEHIFSKVYFPRLVPMMSIVLSKFVIFSVQIVIFGLLVLFLYSEVLSTRVNTAVLLVPVVIFVIVSLACGLGLLVAASTVRYRDFRKSITLSTQLMLYSTPVIYSSTDVPASIEKFLRFNPLSSVFDTLRWGFFSSEAVSVGSLIYSIITSLVVLALGVTAFHHVEQSFVDEI